MEQQEKDDTQPKEEKNTPFNFSKHKQFTTQLELNNENIEIVRELMISHGIRTDC